MGIKQTLDVLNAMEADGAIGRYAIAGAVAAYNYVEPAPTEDLDIIIAFETGPREYSFRLGELGAHLHLSKTKRICDAPKGRHSHRRLAGAVFARRERAR